MNAQDVVFEPNVSLFAQTHSTMWAVITPSAGLRASISRTIVSIYPAVDDLTVKFQVVAQIILF